MKKLPPLLLLLPLFFLPVHVNAQGKESSFALTHVTVIDVMNGRAQHGMTVVVKRERIAAVGKSGSVQVPEDARVIDAAGKFLIPGLWDMHVHVTTAGRPEYFFPMLIANGVTGVRDFGGTLPADGLRQLRSAIAEGTVLGPRIWTAGKILDGAGQFGTTVVVTTDQEARRAVAALAHDGADFIKPYDLLSRDVYSSIVDEARRLKLPVAGHVPFAISAAEASDAGQKSIEHTTGIFIASSRDETLLAKELRDGSSTAALSLPARQRIEAQAIETYDEQKAASLFARFVRNGTWQCPTLVTRRTSILTDEAQLLGDRRMRFIPAPERARWRNIYQQRRTAAPHVEALRKRYEKTLELVGAMHRASVGILAGTDLAQPNVFPGFSLHEELELLVQAGLTPLQALRAATVNPANFLGKEKEVGTVTPGKIADLVLLDANPLENIRNTQRIDAVVVNGRYVPKRSLQEMLAKVEAAANGT